jgi:hypothetical protein
VKIKIVLCLLVSIVTVPVYSYADIAQDNDNKAHYEARKLRSRGYSALYWFMLSSILYHKTHENYPWPSVICALYALDRGVTMVHYFHEAHCCACEEEKVNAAT